MSIVEYNNGETEYWAPVMGADIVPGYEVSNLGNVRSYLTSRGRRRVPKLMKQYTNFKGYRLVGLERTDGRRRNARVHVLILTGFVGAARNDQYVACHNDGNPANNRLVNLRWGTQSSNQADRVLHGTSNRGERNHTAQLTWDKVREIRRRHSTEEVSMRELARQYSVGHTTIINIVNNKTWKTKELS